MTDFWQGFITAIALISVSLIVAALIAHSRQERKRQAAVDAIMARAMAGALIQVGDPPQPAPSSSPRKAVH